MGLKHKKEEPQLPAPVPPGFSPPQDATPAAPVVSGVYCRHGIHDGHFPLHGITVAEARKMLGPLLNLDPKSVAVVNGQTVPEDYVIEDTVAAINFMKPSMVKGQARKAEQLMLEGEEFNVSGGDGGAFSGKLKDLVAVVRNASVLGMDDEPLPRHSVRWKVTSGPLTTIILELDPELRRMMWIAADSHAKRGKEAKYDERRLATPYIVIKVPLLNGVVTGRVELFYRNEPLKHLNDEVYWSNLLNVSPHAYQCVAWLCTQYLSSEKAGKGITGTLDSIIHHTFGGGWNWSSDMSEGKSAFTLSKEQGVDKRVTDVDCWEQESIADPKFVMQVKWAPTGVTIRKLIEDDLKIHKASRDLGQTSEMVSLLLAAKNNKPK